METYHHIICMALVCVYMLNLYGSCIIITSTTTCRMNIASLVFIISSSSLANIYDVWSDLYSSSMMCSCLWALIGSVLSEQYDTSLSVRASYECLLNGYNFDILTAIIFCAFLSFTPIENYHYKLSISKII